MSDTPETQEAVERWQQGKINIFDEMARLERERNDLLKKLDGEEWECVERGKDIETLKSALKAAREERDEARMQYETTLLLADALAKTINEMKAERDA